MNIAIDLDDVVCEFVKPYLNFHNSKFDTSLNFEDVHIHHFWEILGLELKDIQPSFEEFHDHTPPEKLPLINDARESIEKLSTSHSIHFITARPIKVLESTKKFLAETFPNLSFNLIFANGTYNNGSLSKSDHCVNNNINLIIEDSFSFAEECAKNGVNVLLFDQPWNKNHNLSTNMVRVTNWQEILQKIEGLKNAN